MLRCVLDTDVIIAGLSSPVGCLKKDTNMTQIAPYPLRLPRSLKDAVSAAATREDTSMNQFITIACLCPHCFARLGGCCPF